MATQEVYKCCHSCGELYDFVSNVVIKEDQHWTMKVITDFTTVQKKPILQNTMSDGFSPIFLYQDFYEYITNSTLTSL